MPIFLLLSFACVSVLIPQIVILPVSFLTNPPKIFIKVDFPAPLGPNSPYIEPLGISILKSIRASIFFSFFFVVSFT